MKISKFKYHIDIVVTYLRQKSSKIVKLRTKFIIFKNFITLIEIYLHIQEKSH